MKIFDIAFVGAGAGALMASAFIKNSSIALVESSSQIAPKIKISGGGKCNFTNKSVESQNYLGDHNFIDDIFKIFGQKELLKFFTKHGLSFELRPNGKYFCKRDSNQIISIFSDLTKDCNLFLNHKVQEVEFDKNFIIKTDKKTIYCKKLVVSSGGLSYKSLGASDIGYRIAERFGHTIVATAPALVGFTLQKEQFWMKNLSGTSLDVALHVEDKCFRESLLFAHKGISGPSVLSASLYWQKGTIWIDFLPGINILSFISKKNKKQISSVLPMPKRFVKEYLKSISLDDIAIDRLGEQDVKKLAGLNHYEFSPAGNFGFNKAEVTRGGVKSDEINHLTFESIIKKDLYFIGEILDITGELGGYNFQWAFSSGAVMAKYMRDI